MASWKQLLQPPAGALPANLVTKAGVDVIAVLLAGLVLSRSGRDSAVEETAAGGEPGVTGQGVVGQLSSRLTQLAEQRRLEEDDRSRRAAADAAAGPTAGLPPAIPPASGGETGAGDVTLPTAGEVELRERLRLEAIERRARSLCAPSLVQTFREEVRHDDTDPADPDGRAVRDAGAAAPAVAATDGGGASVPTPPDPAVIADRMQAANAALLAGLAGGTAPADPTERTVPGVTGPPVAPRPRPLWSRRRRTRTVGSVSTKGRS